MTKSRGIFGKPTLVRFNEKYIINTETQCWNWQGHIGKGGKGYGVLKVNRVTVRANRLSYELFIGEIPDGLIVCHKCDNTHCVSPFHLFLGTNKDNTDDMIKKGRRINPTPQLPHPSYVHFLKKRCDCEKCETLFREYSKVQYERYGKNKSPQRREFYRLNREDWREWIKEQKFLKKNNLKTLGFQAWMAEKGREVKRVGELVVV